MSLLEQLLPGLSVTIQVTVAAWLLTLVIAVATGLGKASSRSPVRIASTVYIEIFRGTSALVQLFFVFFALPLVDVSLSPYVAGVTVLGLNAGAYGGEIVRGAVQSVHRGQSEAAVALHMPRTLTLRRVVLPQALLEAIPPFTNVMVEILKGSALVSLVTLADLTFRAQLIRASSGETVAPFATILVLYFVLAQATILSMRLLERRLGKWRAAYKPDRDQSLSTATIREPV